MKNIRFALFILLFTSSLAYSSGRNNQYDQISIALANAYSPIVDINGIYFRGSGVLFMLEDEVHILTSSHVIFYNQKSPSKRIQFKIPKTTYTAMNSLRDDMSSSTFTADLIFDDPIADIAFLKVNLHSKEKQSEDNSKKPPFDSDQFLKYWAHQSFSISKDGSLSFSENRDWFPNFGKGGLIGIDYMQSYLATYTPIVDPYNVTSEQDTTISGLLKKQLRVPTFAKPGMSGSLIIKDRELIGVVSKVSLDGSPAVYGVHLNEIAARYASSIKSFNSSENLEAKKSVINTTSAHWKIDSAGKMYLVYTSPQTKVKIWQPLNTNSETLAGGSLGSGGGSLGSGGGSLGSGGESTAHKDTTNNEPPLWKFNAIQTNSFTNYALLSIVNPFSKQDFDTLKVSDGTKTLKSINLVKEYDNNQIVKFKAPSLPLLNQLLNQDPAINFISSHQLVSSESPNYRQNLEELNRLRVHSLQSLKPLYVRYAYKLSSDFLCYPGVGNVWTWDNTLAVDIKNKKSLMGAINHQLTGGLQSSDSMFDGALYHSDKITGEMYVSFFIFNQHNPNTLLDVRTQYGALQFDHNECWDLFKYQSHSDHSTSKKYQIDDHLKRVYNYEIKISKQQLNTININEIINKESKSYTLSRSNNLDSPSLLFTNSTMDKKISLKILLIFNRDNLTKLERIYVNTPYYLFEFIYIPLDENNPR